eukprot:TRINITY_DN17363_c0_g1_i1.p1 TRINITY_DN17363_c0_g1~~TRINITY_DN17363_c0_g1_i1.p1  ORF type:complete len:213 (-),score=40.59 TRINITY_DN17363_c0_g1_i1:61-699(-)
MSAYRCDYTSSFAWQQRIDKEYRAKKAAEAFWNADKNKDGVLDKAEARAIGMTDTQFQKIDINKDGVIGEDELDRFQAYFYEAPKGSSIGKSAPLSAVTASPPRSRLGAASGISASSPAMILAQTEKKPVERSSVEVPEMEALALSDRRRGSGSDSCISKVTVHPELWTKGLRFGSQKRREPRVCIGEWARRHDAQPKELVPKPFRPPRYTQ